MESTDEKLKEIDAGLYNDLAETLKVDIFRVFFHQEEEMEKMEEIFERIKENDKRMSKMVDVLTRTFIRLNQDKEEGMENPTETYIDMLNHGKEILNETLPRMMEMKSKPSIFDEETITTEY